MELNGEQIIKELEGLATFVTCPEYIKDALALIKELTEENERLKSVEFTCGFIKPHKVLECPIFDEIAKTKADTLQEIKTRFAMHFGTYTDKDTVKIIDVFRLIDQIAKEMMED